MADLWIDIEYSFRQPGDGPRVVIQTNVRRGLIDSVLEKWLQDQQGRGVDDRNAEDREAYRIRIEVDLSCDEFTTSSDTGNLGLTCGIILDVFRRLVQPGEVVFL